MKVNLHLYEYKDQIDLRKPHNDPATNPQEIEALPATLESLKAQFFEWVD